MAVAKRKGTNAVWVSEEILKEAERFAHEVLPEGVHMRTTRDYGRTADEKVNELVEALLVAIAIVVILLAYTLGWREGIIIALAVPVTFSFTLLINLLLGYTINRVTLFAMILSLGLVVDDPIVDVENIHRHFSMRKEAAHAGGDQRGQRGASADHSGDPGRDHFLCADVFHYRHDGALHGSHGAERAGGHAHEPAGRFYDHAVALFAHAQRGIRQAA